MVELIVLQSLSYMAGALGVCIAAIYYVINLRVQQENMKETTKNRRAVFANNLLQSFLSEEGQLRYLEVMNMQWTDIDDYVKKYDSSRNPQNFAKRYTLWATCDAIGLQYRSGVIDLDAIDSNTMGIIVTLWWKFRHIFEHYREWEWAKTSYADFEYLAGAVEKWLGDHDPDYRTKMNLIITTHQEDQ